MSHIDEGLLHALLDGAIHAGDDAYADITGHLDFCADCRARLEEARAIKAAAHDVLAAVRAPTSPTRDFDDVLRRAGAVSPAAAAAGTGGVVARKNPRTRRMISLAWAASIGVALGAGWIARSLSVAPADFAAVTGEPVADAASREADAGFGSAGVPGGEGRAASAPDAQRAQADAQHAQPDAGRLATARDETAASPAAASPSPTSAEGIDISPAAPLAVRPREEAGEVAATPAADMPLAAPAPNRTVADAADARAVDPAGAAGRIPVTRTQDGRPSVLALDEIVVTGTVSPVTTRDRLAADARAPVPAPVAMVEPLERQNAARAVEVTPRATTGGTQTGTALRDGARTPPPPAERSIASRLFGGSDDRAPSGTRWRTANPRDAERRLGRPVAAVPGLEIHGHWLAEEAGIWTVRTEQRTAAGVSIELTQWYDPVTARLRAEAAGEFAVVVRTTERPDGTNVVFVDLADGSHASLSAALPLAALTELARSVQPVERDEAVR